MVVTRHRSLDSMKKTAADSMAKGKNSGSTHADCLVLTGTDAGVLLTKLLNSSKTGIGYDTSS